jgi:carbon-monoxide dehydrogenase medium subunit
MVEPAGRGGLRPYAASADLARAPVDSAGSRLVLSRPIAAAVTGAVSSPQAEDGVKPAPFGYVKATALAQVFELLAAHGEDAKILAGGQSLIATLAMRLSAPQLLIDINGLPDLARIEVAGDRLLVGALVRHVVLGADPAIRRHAPLLALAVPHIAHPAIRNRGTLGGSLAFADPAAELPACAVALDATMVMVGPGGERRLPARQFFRGLYQTALAPDELLAGIELPLAGADTRCGFDELARRHGDYAMAGLAAQGRWAGDRFAALNLVYFGVGTGPVEAKAAAAALGTGAFDAAQLQAAQAALGQDLDPPPDLHGSGKTKLHLARVLLGRVLHEMADGAAR